MWIIHSILFRDTWKKKRFQPFFSRLFNWALFSMNYSGGGDFETSGEKWFVRNIVAEFSRDSSKPPVVFDVGANIGDYSEFVQECLPGARVWAFEPCLETYNTLVNNLAATKVTAVKMGFSDKSGTNVIYNYSFDGQPANVLASLERRLPTQHGNIEVASEEEIALGTIDEFADENGIDRITLLKIDIEGHELKALQGAKLLLEREAIDFIQFEFGPANLYSKTTFYDFWTVLSERYDIHRLLPDGMLRIPAYEEQLEIYLTTNYIAVSKQVGRERAKLNGQ